MGVHGLWRLIEPSGKPVPLESLENKVLAVDVSIWLHQLIKGFQDSKGASVPNAHLLGIYHRVCKLLYFRIKPVFVFDGGVPVLKKNTIAQRNQSKQKNLSEADRIHKNLISALVKHTAISKVLSEKAKAAISASTSPTKKSKPDEDELFVLPPSQLESKELSDNESDDGSLPSRHFDLHSINPQSVEFKSLPVDVRHEILSDLKETRKQSSWGRLNELPTESNDFATYQMKRLLKRQSVQTALEEVEKEMGGHSLSLGELEKILKDQGVINSVKGNRIASDENTRFLLIKNIKQAIDEARKEQQHTLNEEDEQTYNKIESIEITQNKGDKEFEDDLQKAITLSLEDVPSTSKEEPSTSEEKINTTGKKRINLSFLNILKDEDFDDTESSEEDEIRTRLTPAQRYMMEYSGLSSHAIAQIIEENSKRKKSSLQEKIRVQPVESSTEISVEVENSIENLNDQVKKRKNFEENEELDITLSDDEQVSKRHDEDQKDCEPLTKNKQISEVFKNQKLVSTSTVEDTKASESPTEDREIFDHSTKDTQISASPIEEMSDSEESSEDFLEVSQETSLENTIDIGRKPVEEIDNDFFEKEGKECTKNALEVIIKPDDEIDDDLFKDIFENEIETESAIEENTEKRENDVKSDEKSPQEKSKTTSEKTLAKIDQMIKTYSKPQECVMDKTNVSKEQLQEVMENLQKEQQSLVAEKTTKERLASNITDQMCQEAQELLELFGVPYLVAPMEAEAQCAFLDLINLTDGTITDDSDIWLFGGKTVYKNFFDQNKLVMEFKAESIQRTFKLSREQMILLAMLVGSDYTVGLTGVGPVTALEILAAFPSKNQLISGLIEFKSWFKKGKLPGPGRTSLRGKLKNVVFHEGFPNPQIIQAYLEPTIESSRENFTWAQPDIPGLIEFARQKFGWTKTKSEEILNPVLRRMHDSRKQKAITDYFHHETLINPKQDEEKLAVMSKRVKSAIEKIARGPTSDEEIDIPKKKTVRKVKTGGDLETKNTKKKIKLDEDLEILKETKKQSQKRLKEIKNEISKEVEERKSEKVVLQRLHHKEVIPQRQKDKTEMLKNKLKAIETFRKSKQGPGFVKKRAKSQKEVHKDTSYLSEDSNSD